MRRRRRKRGSHLDTASSAVDFNGHVAVDLNPVQVGAAFAAEQTAATCFRHHHSL
jgi:hypothetical protein